MVKAVTPIPFVKARFFDRCGKPLAGGKVYTYEANTTTAKTTYKDPYGLTPNTNPIILDAAGEADIYLDGTYRIRITDRNDVLVNDVAKIGSWFSDNLQDTLDNISGAMDDAIKPMLQNLDDVINTAAKAGAGANGWTDQLILLSNGRTQKQKNAELVTPYDFGAIGDGVYHKLSEKYATLADAKKKYPTAQSLDDSVDLCALEAFFNHCQDNVVNANITLNAYVNRPLELGMGAKGSAFKTLVYYGDLSLKNNQNDTEITHLMRINAADTVWLGKLRFYGSTVAVKDRKQLVGLIIGDGGTDGSAGRIQIRSVTAFYFKCAGLVLANDSIFPRIDYVNIGWIGSTSGAWYNSDGVMGGNFVDNTVANHTATISARTDIGGDFGQRSVLTVSSLPPEYSVASELAPRMVMFEGDNLPYVIKDIDVAKNQISVYPKLKNPATTNYNRLGYIYGTGLAWQGNNSGAGAFGHIQFITCGIGFWGGSLFGANINFLSTEWCGVGFTLGMAFTAAIAYNINTAYFEANVFDYVQQWGNGEWPLLNLGISNNLKVNLIAEMQSYRFGADDTRLQDRFDLSSITFKNNRYDIRNPYRSSVDLSDPRDVLPAIVFGGGLQLMFSNINFNYKFKMYTKTIVISNSWAVNGDNITLKAPEGWTINDASSITLYRKAEATVLTVTILEQNYWRNKVMFVAGESIYRPSGTTAERPVNVPTGYMYLDTTLAAGGKPIYKTATGWVDGLGAVV
ncbi:hypothetical protein ENHAE0001_2223 [Enhydrobacter aerosaccus SK60]|nr:hypothetical protein ENHAE0001_2223 [Enhydrobacter aerosaccus SK60]